MLRGRIGTRKVVIGRGETVMARKLVERVPRWQPETVASNDLHPA